MEIILGQQRGSATLLQRALSVGYTRATRLLELMEQDGLVGAHNGSKSREVYLTFEEWQVQEEAIAEELAASEGDGDQVAEDSDQEEFDDSASAEDVDSDEALASPATEEFVDDQDTP